MRRSIILLISFAPISITYHKRLPAGITPGTLTDGVGCGNVLIEVDSKTVFQPVNLDSFPAVSRKLGLQVLFSYTELDNATFCMDVPPIRLITIRDY
jgi:hypothetical protein